MFQDNVIRYDTAIVRTTKDTGVIQLESCSVNGKDFYSYNVISNGMVTKYYVTYRGDTFIDYDYTPTLSFNAFDLKMESIKQDINAFESIELKPLPAIGDSRPASTFIELPEPIKPVPNPNSADAICNAAVFAVAVLAYSIFIIQTRNVWAEFFGKFGKIIRA
jgi:hypothetical protein